MLRKSRDSLDRAIQDALAPGEFIEYRFSYGFVEDLEAVRHEILKKLGRSGDALAAAWEEFRTAPSSHRYQELMKYIPKAARADWHAKLMAILDDADLSASIGIFMLTREQERLAAVIESAPQSTTWSRRTDGLMRYTFEIIGADEHSRYVQASTDLLKGDIGTRERGSSRVFPVCGLPDVRMRQTRDESFQVKPLSDVVNAP